MTSSLTIYKLEQIQTITHQLVFIVSEEIKKKTLVRGTWLSVWRLCLSTINQLLNITIWLWCQSLCCKVMILSWDRQAKTE